MQLRPWQSWPELVFHVLAHLPASARHPASAYDPRYCAFVADHVGCPSQRPLAEDAGVLQRLLPTHAALAHAQLLAWLFDEVAQALAVAEVDVAQLAAAQVARPWALAGLRGEAAGVVAGAPLHAVELLRCAALLEQPVLAALPTVTVDEAALRRALVTVAPAAPNMAALCWRPVRALTQRGRVARGEVWTGAPSAAGALPLSTQHVAWQLAHEATVVEVAQRLAPAAAGGATTDPAGTASARVKKTWLQHHREVERLALRLLHARARDVHLHHQHQLWLQALHPSAAACCHGPVREASRALIDAWR